jgi:hypothetical protein
VCVPVRHAHDIEASFWLGPDIALGTHAGGRMSIPEAIVLVCFSFAALPWVVYPALLFLWPTLRSSTVTSKAYDGVVSVLIPAHNEIDVIRQKLENVFSLDWPRELLDVIVCSDGSDDGTDELVDRYRRHGVRLLRQPERLGKASAINRMVDEAVGDVVLLSDASAELPSEAVKLLLEQLCRPRVGIVSSRYAVAGKGGEAGYWSVDTGLRTLAASRGVLIGAHGAGMMAWRGLLPRLEPDTINDDYVLPLRVASKGYRVAYAPLCVVRDAPTTTLTTVFFRVARIAGGNLQMIGRHLGAARDPAIAASLLFHKFPKTVGPALLAGAAAIAAWKAPTSTPLAVVAGGAGLATLSAGLGVALIAGGARPPGVLRAAAFALTSAAAAALGVVAYPLLGANPRWRREPSRPAFDAPAPVPLRVRIVKRTIDITSAAIGLVLSAPVVAVLAVIIKLDSPGRSCTARTAAPTTPAAGVKRSGFTSFGACGPTRSLAAVRCGLSTMIHASPALVGSYVCPVWTSCLSSSMCCAVR